jgi:hypothetical protein
MSFAEAALSSNGQPCRRHDKAMNYERQMLESLR